MNVTLTKTQKILVESSGDIARIMRQILLRENRISRQKEHLWAVGLNADFSILYVELIAFGIPAKGKVKPMEIFRLALQKEAEYMYLCHNRKTADMAAQPDDKALTDRMIQVGNIVGINVYDHVIINAKTEDYLSFADVGLMEELRKSTAWVPKFEQIKKIKAMAKAEERKQTQITIAKTMKKNKVSADLISKFTGLSVEEIKSL